LLRELLYRLPPNPRSVRRAVDRLFDGFASPSAPSPSSSLVVDRAGNTAVDPFLNASTADTGALSEPEATRTRTFVRVDESFEVEGAPGLVLAGAVQLGVVSAGVELLLGPFARRRVPLSASSDETALPLSGSEAKTRPYQPFDDGAVAQCKGSCDEKTPSFFCWVRVTSIHLHGMAVASIAAGQVATFAVSVAKSGFQSSPTDVWPLEKRCKGMVLVDYAANEARHGRRLQEGVPPAPKPQVVLEFDAEVIFLHSQHPAAHGEQPQVDHEPMIYVQSVAQTARIVSIDSKEDGTSAFSSTVPASVAPQPSGPVISRTPRQHTALRIRFRFVHRPEFVSVGDWLFLRDGSRGAGSFARMGIGRILKSHRISDPNFLIDHSHGTAAPRRKGNLASTSSPITEAPQPDFWA
jgi:hypothetical protein